MRNSKGQFVKGHKTWNKGTKGVMKPNKTSFKKGQTAQEKSPSWKGGIQWTERDGYQIQYAPNKRMSLARWVWQQVYGELPKGYIIRHKDGDKKNNDISNLEAITRAENLALNSRNYAV